MRRVLGAWLRTSFEVVAMIDPQAKVLYTSPPTKNVLGYDNTELLGHSMFEWMHPEDVPGIQEIFQGLIKNPGSDRPCDLPYAA